MTTNTHQPPTAPKEVANKSVPATWAKVAAIDAAALSRIKGNLSIAPKPRPAQRLPYEKPADQKRVVWLHPLPTTTTLFKLSQNIHEGPVYSILLEADKHETLPGLSACVIFQHASSAASLLDGFPSRNFPKGAEAKVGGPFPIDADLYSMVSHPWPRRRLKWSRSRLFYDVHLLTFKKLVLTFAGGNGNVEFVHFYNAGEATAVLASVGVAKAVLEGFARLRKGLGCTAEEAQLWREVEMGYVTDMNEKPMALFSQYDRDGSIRQFKPGQKGGGLFEGPHVKDEEIFGKE